MTSSLVVRVNSHGQNSPFRSMNELHLFLKEKGVLTEAEKGGIAQFFTKDWKFIPPRRIHSNHHPKTEKSETVTIDGKRLAAGEGVDF